MTDGNSGEIPISKDVTALSFRDAVNIQDNARANLVLVGESLDGDNIQGDDLLAAVQPYLLGSLAVDIAQFREDYPSAASLQRYMHMAKQLSGGKLPPPSEEFVRYVRRIIQRERELKPASDTLDSISVEMVFTGKRVEPEMDTVLGRVSDRIKNDAEGSSTVIKLLERSVKYMESKLHDVTDETHL